MSDDNYYKVGGSLEYQHPTYVRRKADSDLYEGLKNGEFCYVLNSRQMGKSSLRVQMMKQLKEQGFKCASIDMTRIGSHVTPAEWYAGVVSELLRGFGLGKKVNFSSWWRDREMLPPLQRLSELIEDVLLAESSQKLVIFIDEIDSIIKIKFKEDFFAFIRACYNQRVDNSEYNRLTFCLLGVATPSDLIEDRNLSTPFNIGRAIELTGFQLHEATPLAQGLTGKTSDSQALMREVLAWTGGQPFLTQKVCKLILNAEGMIPEGNEAVWVENLVRSRLTENWETQDEPEHLRTVRDRILWSLRKGQLLQLYQQILQSSFAPPYQGGDGGVKAKDAPEHMELRLSGLVVKQQGKLRVYNRIYEFVFNQSWVENGLAEAGLLPKVAETPIPQAEIQALEQAVSKALRQLESQQIEALLLAIQAGQALKTLMADGRPLQDYPTISPLSALQRILDNIRERNQFNSYLSKVYIHDVRFSPDGEKIVTAEDDGTIQLWKQSGQQLLRWKAHWGAVRSVSFSPNGDYLATAGRDGKARLWNLSGQQITEFDNHQGWGLGVCFSPDGQQLVTVGGGHKARLWNLFGQQIAQFDGHRSSIWSVSFSSDGQQLATAGMDGKIRLWNLSGQQIAQFEPHQGEAWSVSFSPDGQQLATAGNDNIARLWNLSGHLLVQLNGHQGMVRSVSFSPDGQQLATAGYDGTVRIWNLLGQQLAQLNGHCAPVLSVCYSPDGQYLTTAGSDGTARLWHVSEKHLPQLKGHQGSVWSVNFSPDGQLIATAGRDGTARLWNLSGQQLAQFDGHQGSVWTVSFSPNGQYVVTTGSDSTARLWNLSGQQLAQFDGHQGWVTRVIFSPDEQRLATLGRNGTARLWDLSGQLISQVIPQQGWVWSVSFSSDGQLVATVGLDSTPPLLDSSGRFIIQLKGDQGKIGSTSFSPDGQYLATASLEDGTARLWNLSGQQLTQLDSQQGWVISVSFNPDGQLVATGGEDGSVCLWDLSGRQIFRFESNQGTIYGMSFSPNGQCLATAGKDGTVRLWRVEGLDELLARGCDWLKDYFVTHPEALEKLGVCQNKLNSLEAGKNLDRATEAEEAISDRAANPKEHSTSLSQQDEEHAIAKFPSSAQTSKSTSKRILWVDDKPANIADEIARLQEKGIEVTQALSTAQAMQILLSSGLSFDAIITDMGRTEEGEYQPEAGILFIKAIRKTGINLPILVYTTLGLYARTINEVVAAGGNGATMSAEELSAWLRDYTNLATKGDIEEPLDQAIPSRDNLPSSASVACNELNSEQGIDYTRLRDLLAAGWWKEAERQTTELMLRIAGRAAERWLREEDIENFPCTDLLTIDNLWVKYSEGRFGFSVQKKIWQSIGGTKNAHYKIYRNFSKRVGWGDGYNSWLYSSNLTFNTTAPIGHLPGGLLDWLWSSYRQSRLRLLSPYKQSWLDLEAESADSVTTQVWWNILSSLTSRLTDCNVPSPSPKTVAKQRLVTTVSNEPGEGFLGEFLVHDKLVSIYQGDITNLVTDVIVSSDDSYLTMGGGVSYSIRKVGGEEIYREASNLVPLSLGEVAVTTAGQLQAKKVFHAVVIDFYDREGPSEDVIQRVVHACMKKACGYKFGSIAFPLLGTGTGRFPVKVAWEITLRQVIRDLADKNQNIAEVVLVLYGSQFVEELNIKRVLEKIKNFGWRGLL